MPQVVNDDELDLDLEVEEESESPKGLRAKLGAVHKQLSEAQRKLARYEAKELLQEKGFDLVEVEEVLDVPADQREAKAKEIQERRLAEQEKLLRRLAERLGISTEDGDAFEDLVSEVLGARAAQSDTAEVVNRARSLSQIESEPVPVVDPSKLHGEQAIEHALRYRSGKRKG